MKAHASEKCLLFHLPACFPTSNKPHKETRNQPEFIQAEGGQLPPAQLGPGVSVPTMHDNSHSSVLGCGGGCGHKLLAVLCRDRILPSGGALLTDPLRAVFSPCSGVILFFLLIKPKTKFAGLPFGECHFWTYTVSAAVCVGGMCGAVCEGQVTQGAGPRLVPPSAPVKAELRTKLVIEMPGPGAPLLLVLHGKQDRTQCLSLLLGILFLQNYYFC